MLCTPHLEPVMQVPCYLFGAAPAFWTAVPVVLAMSTQAPSHHMPTDRPLFAALASPAANPCSPCCLPLQPAIQQASANMEIAMGFQVSASCRPDHLLLLC